MGLEACPADALDGHVGAELSRLIERHRRSSVEDHYRPLAAPRAMFNLGNLLEQRERFDEAEVGFRDAIASGHPDVEFRAMVALRGLQ